MKAKLEEVVNATMKKNHEGESSDKGKEKIAEEDIIPTPYPPLIEEPFLKEIKVAGGKSLEGIPLYSGKMDPKLVIEWIKGIENHF